MTKNRLGAEWRVCWIPVGRGGMVCDHSRPTV
jgi:hypothetical protein